ncbi:MAG: hypothetical protein ABIF77_20870 [bacterium]
MSRFKTLLWGLAGLLTVVGGPVMATEAPPLDLAASEATLQNITQQVDSLTASRQDLLRQADELAQLIVTLRRRDALSQSEHTELARMLRDSQGLQEQLADVDAAIQARTTRHENLLADLLRALQLAIDQTLTEVETAAASRAEALTTQLRTLIARKEAWEARQRPRFLDQTVGYPIADDPTDTPRQLRMKADILSDQADAIGQEVATVEERIQALGEEKRVREKVQELASELDLFDEREELMARESVQDEGRYVDGGEVTGPEDPAAIFAPQPSDGIGAAYSLEIAEAMNDPTPRSPATIQEWIDRLGNHRDWMRSRADSLQERAAWFHQQATEKAE